MVAYRKHPNDDYALGRDFASGIRLNLQHFLWVKYTGYLLHPSIPRHAPNLSIADVGTGTGIWLIDIADELDQPAKLHGFDIDISHTPSPTLLPSTMKMSVLDILQNDVPDELHGKYNIINIRLFVFVVKSNDPTPILRNLIKMLKPGGWIQWAEVEMTHQQIETPTTHCSKAAMEQMTEKIVPTDSRFVTGNWIPSLGTIFETQGLTQVESDVKAKKDNPRHWFAFQQMNSLSLFDEVIRKMPASNTKTELEALLDQSVVESKQGVAFNTDRVTWIGRKPL